MGWILLAVAGLAEVVWLVALKWSMGFSRLWPTVAVVVFSTGSFVLLSMALKTLPLATAYAVWTSIGVLGASIAGVALFGEQLSAYKLLSMLLVIVGVAGLHLTK